LIRYLIDTDVASEMRKSKPHDAALAWLRNLSLGHGYFSAVTATVRLHGLTIATRNERDFKTFSVPLVNPFR